MIEEYNKWGYKRSYSLGHNSLCRQYSTRQCVNCNSPNTTLRNGDKWPLWYRYEGGYLCNKCYHKLIASPKNNSKKVKFYDKRIVLEGNPRKGICSICGAVQGVDCKKTNIHHLEYDPYDPLAHTIELCASCHTKQHPKLRNEIGQFI